MNLIAYEQIPATINKQKTWTDITNKRIISREIEKRTYYCFSKRYDADNKTTIYYLILLDDIPNDRLVSETKVDNYGRVRFNAAYIWNESSLNNITNNININVSHIEHTDDGDIYELDI